MECAICKQIKQPTKEVGFSCDSCRNPICLECSELSSSEIKCLPLQKRLLKFHCKQCRKYGLVDILQKSINDKEIIINDKNEIIKMLQDKLKTYEDKHYSSPEICYADIVKKTAAKRDVVLNYPDIIVKPKEAQTFSEIKNDINKNVNPANLKIGVKSFRATKSGSVIIKCQNKNETEILEKAIQEKLKDTYDVESTKMRRPRIKITNFNQDMKPEEIENCIKEQNELAGEIKVTYVKKTRDGLNIIFCECSAISFNKIMYGKKLCIGWERYPVYEDLTIPRCFHCQAFYHKKTNCKNKLVCPLCGGDHEERECPKHMKSCKNCILSNEKYKSGYKVDHYVTDPECPTLKYHQQKLKNKTDYFSEW